MDIDKPSLGLGILAGVAAVLIVVGLAGGIYAYGFEKAWRECAEYGSIASGGKRIDCTKEALK